MAHSQSILRDASGAVTIELALAAPILAAMLIGAVDLSTAYSAKLQLEQAAQRTIEKVQQNGFKPADETTLETEAATAAGVAASAANLTYWKECTNSSGTRSTVGWTTDCSNGDTYARYVRISIQKTYTPVIMAKFMGANADGTFTLNGIAGVRVQ